MILTEQLIASVSAEQVSQKTLLSNLEMRILLTPKLQP